MWAQFSARRSLEHHVIDTTGHAPSETLTAVRAAVEAGTFLLRRNPVSGAARGGERERERERRKARRSAPARPHRQRPTESDPTDQPIDPGISALLRRRIIGSV